MSRKRKINYLGGNNILSQFQDNVEVIDLSSRNISSLPDDFARFTNLKKLILDDNKLTTLPNSIGSLENLEELFLNGNYLTYTSLQNTIMKLHKLIRLGLARNGLKYLPDSIFSLENLEDLILTNNRLTSLPNEFCNLANLMWLRLDNNKLTSLPDNISNLTELVHLNLSGNKTLNINSLPDSFYELDIVTLDLSDMNLSSLPEKICEKLTTLTYLHLENNKSLNTLPDCIGNRLDDTNIYVEGTSITPESLPQNLPNNIVIKYYTNEDEDNDNDNDDEDDSENDNDSENEHGDELLHFSNEEAYLEALDKRAAKDKTIQINQLLLYDRIKQENKPIIQKYTGNVNFNMEIIDIYDLTYDDNNSKIPGLDDVSNFLKHTEGNIVFIYDDKIFFSNKSYVKQTILEVKMVKFGCEVLGTLKSENIIKDKPYVMLKGFGPYFGGVIPMIEGYDVVYGDKLIFNITRTGEKLVSTVSQAVLNGGPTIGASHCQEGHDDVVCKLEYVDVPEESQLPPVPTTESQMPPAPPKGGKTKRRKNRKSRKRTTKRKTNKTKKNRKSRKQTRR